MLKHAIIAGIVLCTGGCAQNAPLGNFTQNPAAFNQIIARDAVKQLAALYPPAKTRFEIKQPTPDAFGNGLVTGLRREGYALNEFHQDETAISALPVRYVLDKTDSELALYRLTIWVGDQSMTRPYRKHDRTVVPAGYWAYKE